MVVRTPSLVYIYFSIVSKQMNVNQGFSSFSLSQQGICPHCIEINLSIIQGTQVRNASKDSHSTKTKAY